jgi:DNA-binding XRE family transcriptional regulator
MEPWCNPLPNQGVIMVGRYKGERHNPEFIALWKELGLTQREIAGMIGVGFTTVKSWYVEEGKEMAATCPK